MLLFFLLWLAIETIIWSLPYTVSLQREQALFSFVGKYIVANEYAQKDEKLQNLANQLAAHLNLPENVVKVYVSEQDIPNAYATFGANVVLYRGLLNRLPHEEGVASVLAHEIAHIKHRDPLRGLSRGVLYRAVAAILGINGQADFFLRMEGLRYSRDVERRADNEAMEAVYRQYGHVAGMKELFDTLGRIDKDNHLSSGLTWLNSHPDTDERLQNVVNWSEAKNLQHEVARLPNIWQKK